MIITFEEFPRRRRTVAMVDGAFDPLHARHIEYFRAVEHVVAAAARHVSEGGRRCAADL